MIIIKFFCYLMTVILSAFFISNGAFANIEVRFIEGAPKDEFLIRNIGNCSIKRFVVDIDLTNSAGNLIFDTSSSGQGVDVFQPFEVSGGKFELLSQSKDNEVKDGDKRLSLKIAELKPNESVSFTIDVDDTLTNSQLGQIRVNGSEIEGTVTRLNINGAKNITSTFGNNNQSLLSVPPCT